jgi:HK97 family phage major capsid protein
MAAAIAEIRAMREKQQNKVALARAELAKITETTPAAEREAAERAHDAFIAEYDVLQGRIDREEATAEREARLAERDANRPLGEDRSADGQGDAKLTPKEQHRAAYQSYMRYGLEGLTADERKLIGPQRRLAEGEAGVQARAAQGVGDSVAGGYTVPEGFMSELVISTKLYGPMLDPGITREIATTTGNQLPWPSMDDTSNKGRRIGENQPVVETTVGFGVNNLFAYKYTSDVVKVSSELLQDSGVDIETIVRDAMSERIGRIVNQDLTTGTGASMPTGIAFAVPTGMLANAAASGAITFDDMIELEHTLDPTYRTAPNCRWQFHDLTLKALRKLKDGDGTYIWQPASVIAKAPATILGYSYSINQDNAQIGSGNKSVLFGDHGRFVVRRVKEFLVRRLTERYADNDQVGFIGFGRYDGALVDQKAMAALKHP